MEGEERAAEAACDSHFGYKGNRQTFVLHLIVAFFRIVEYQTKAQVELSREFFLCRVVDKPLS